MTIRMGYLRQNPAIVDEEKQVLLMALWLLILSLSVLNMEKQTVKSYCLPFILFPKQE